MSTKEVLDNAVARKAFKTSKTEQFIEINL
jgi:hypothetical protein